jgi:hypothetical protein
MENDRMSEISTQGDSGFEKVGLPRLCGYATSLLGDCDELVGLIAKSNSPDGPYNSVEARNGSEADFALAHREQAAMINRVEYLAAQITDRAATSDDEIEAKVHALDALAAVASWERDSLRTLRVSIDRDRAEVKKALHPHLVARSRPGWLSRCLACFLA